MPKDAPLFLSLRKVQGVWELWARNCRGSPNISEKYILVIWMIRYIYFLQITISQNLMQENLGSDPHFYNLICKDFLFACFERETERERKRDHAHGERGRRREKILSRPHTQHWARLTGLNPTDHEIITWAQIKSQGLSHWATTQEPLICKVLNDATHYLRSHTFTIHNKKSVLQEKKIIF